MANDSYTQQALAGDPNFQRRVSGALSSVAWQVLDEADTVPFHDQRAAYARHVLNGIDQAARATAPWLVMRPNLMAFATSYNFPAAAVVTASGDADIQSQLMTDWNDLASVGIDVGPVVALGVPPSIAAAPRAPVAPIAKKDRP